MAEILTGILAVAVWLAVLAYLRSERAVAKQQPPLREQERWAAEQLYGGRR